jgi:2,5-diamino-6-(ribosylamino)-4(3H)-pyrimidinone 5'-phosphate reductase
MISCIY